MSNNIKETNDLKGKQTKPITTPSKQIGVDTDKNFLNSLLSSVQVSAIDLGKLEKFTTLSEQRSQIYDLLDYMASDSKVSAVLETYAGDCTETNDNGHIVWAESNQPQVAEYINYLLGIMNVDKYSYTWILSLCKYGDLYLRLYRNSDEDTDVIFKNAKDKIRTITEQKMQKIEEQQHKNINENVNIVVYASNDHYLHYVEMVPNPAEMFELVKHGKTYGYIKANVRITNSIENNLRQTYLQYKFKDNDVNVFEATEFVHASLSSDIDRNAEEVTLITSGDKEEKASYTYRVKRGKSLLADSYKVWRELSLLENSVILNRLTRSSIVRLVQIEVGDMPKEAVANWLLNFKQLVEQKSAINTLGENAGINEYTNPGPVENIIYVPTHEQKGSITMNTIGGDYDPKELTDLDYFLNEFYGALRVPKQYFCLRGDTKITLLTGEVVSIAEMYNNKDKYLKSGILSCNQDGTLEPTQIKDIMLTRKDATFVRVYLDNGSFIDTTPDHRFMLRDGSYKEAKDLTNTDALMPYYERISKDGRKEVLDNKLEEYNILQYVPECNHKVVKVEQLDVVEDAFDIEVFSNNHNFALSAGVFVHNCNTDDSTGFNGGTSLSIISSRYGKEIIRIQNAFIQALTDAVNLMLLDAHLDAYIGKFTLKMQKPTTQEDVDRRSAEETTMNNMSKLLDLVSSDIQSSARRLEIVKALLPQVNVSNDILQILDDEIKEQKAEEDNNSNNKEQDELNIGPNREERPSRLPRFDTNEMQEEPENNLQSDFERMTFGNNEENTENETNVNNTETNTENEEDDNLPSPEELGQDLTITQ